MTDTPDITPTQTGGESAVVMSRAEALMEVTYQLLALDDLDSLRRVLNGEHEADIADLMEWLDDETRPQVFALLDESLAADVLAETDVVTTQAIAEEIDQEALSDLVEEMAPDDAADLLADLPEESAAQVLDNLEAEEAEVVQELMAHEEDTGGGIMTPEFIVAHDEATVTEVVDTMRREAEDADIFDIYVVDPDEKLVGIVPVNRLVTARPHAAVSNLMVRDFQSVTVETDQEDIAELFTRYDLIALPVVDDEGRLVGQITIDDVVDVIHEEATEDIYKMAGTNSEQEIERPSILGVVRARLPWLLICLAGSFVSGIVINLFDVTLEKVITLAVFLPAITATGGNSGLQSSTVTVRGLVTGRVSGSLVIRTIAREVGIAAVIGFACGLSAALVAWLWFGQQLVGICVGTAMFLAISVAVILGVLVPIVFDKLGIDPAVASGPFITTTNDVLGLFIYLGLATMLVQRFA